MKAFAQRYMRNYGAVAGLAIMLIVVVVALAARSWSSWLARVAVVAWMMVADPLIRRSPTPTIPLAPTCWGATSPPAWSGAPGCR